MFKGTPTLGTTDWVAERPLIERINEAEGLLIDELNRERNTLRERGVFHDYAHRRSTPRPEHWLVAEWPPVMGPLPVHGPTVAMTG